VIYGPDGREFRIAPSLRPTDPEIPAVSQLRPPLERIAPRDASTQRTRDSLSERVREHVDHLWEWVEAAAIEVPGVRATLFLWKKSGLIGVLAVLLVAPPLGEYSLLSYAVNHTVPRLAGEFGVAIEADDWSYHPFSLKTVARHVQVRPLNEPHATPVFTAAEVELNGSASSAVKGVWELAADLPSAVWHLRLPVFHTFNQITIHHGELRIERRRTGHLNWSDYAADVPEETLKALIQGRYQVNTLVVDDLKLQYVEQLAGNSGGGITETAAATIHIDSIEGALTNYRAVSSGDSLPTKIQLSGRSADGQIDVDGRLAFAPPREDLPRSAADAAQALRVADRADRAALLDDGGPYYTIKVTLTNIGARALVETVPFQSVVPVEGTVRGNTTFSHLYTDRGPSCIADVRAIDLKFTPNPKMVPRSQYARLRKALQDQPAAQKLYCTCEALVPVSNQNTGQPSPIVYEPDERQPVRCTLPVAHPVAPDRDRPVYASDHTTAPAGGLTRLVTSFNEQANKDGPPEVRALLARDRQTLTGQIASAALGGIAGQLGQKLSNVLSPQASSLIQQSLRGGTEDSAAGGSPTPSSRASSRSPTAADRQQNGNVLTKGAKGVGQTFKKLFGGGKKDPKKD
jgi:hypothetical protein